MSTAKNFHNTAAETAHIFPQSPMNQWLWLFDVALAITSLLLAHKPAHHISLSSNLRIAHDWCVLLAVQSIYYPRQLLGGCDDGHRFLLHPNGRCPY